MKQPNTTVDIEQTQEVSCPECSSQLFKQSYKLRKVSALVSPTGEEALIPVMVFICESCNVEMHFNQNE